MKFGKFSISIILIIIVVVGGTLYWFNTHASIDKAMNNLSYLKTSEYTAHVVLNNTSATQQLLGENGTIDITLAGAFDRKVQPANLQAELNLAVKTNSVSLGLDGELKMIKDKFYAIINTAPASIPLFAQLKGQWIEMPRNASNTNSSVELPSTNLLTKITRVGNESINNENTVHYKAVATSDAIVAMTTNMAHIIGSQLTSAQADEIRAGVTKTGDVPVDLWITPWSNQMRKMSAVIPVPNSNTINFDLTLINGNKSVDITVPQGAETLQQAAKNAQAKVAPVAPIVTPTP
jgi:hypothetical protein